MKNDFRGQLSVAAAVIAGYGALMACGISCPVLWLTGVSCAGCGMTRAWLCVLRGDFARAFRFHPLWPLVPAGGLVWLVRSVLPPKVYRGCKLAFCTVFFAVYLVRLADPADPVAVVHPQEGVVGKWFVFLYQKLP